MRALVCLLDDHPVTDKRYGDASPSQSGETTGRNLMDSAEAEMLAKIEDQRGALQICK